LALSATLAACGADDAVDDGPGKSVQVWSLYDPSNVPIVQRGIVRFNADSGTGARLTTYENDAYKSKLQTALGSPDGPDVFFNWGGGNLAQFVKAGRVHPLTDALKAQPDVAKSFLPSVLALGQLDGVQYGLPMSGIQPVVLFYNKKVFKDAHVDPPTSYQDILDLVEVFKARGVTPVALAGGQGWTELMWLEYLLDRIGGASMFANIAAGKPGAWRAAPVKAALGRCLELVKAGAFGRNFATVNYDNLGASKLLATGKAAMHLMGSFEYVNQVAANKSFVSGGDLGWVSFPMVAGGTGDPGALVGNPSNFFAVREGSPVLDAATRFVVETMSSDAYIDELIKAGQVPAVKGVAPKLGAKEGFANFTYQLVSQGKPFTQSWDQALGPVVGAALNANLQKVFQQQMSVDEFIAAMEAVH